MLLFNSFSIPFLVVLSASYYFFLKDDYMMWKKHQSFEGLKSEELVELVAKLRNNRFMMMFELMIGIIVMVAFMSLLIDVLNIKMPLFLSFTLSPVYLISLNVYVFKKRMRKSIDIFKNAKRTA